MSQIQANGGSSPSTDMPLPPSRGVPRGFVLGPEEERPRTALKLKARVVVFVRKAWRSSRRQSSLITRMAARTAGNARTVIQNNRNRRGAPNLRLGFHTTRRLILPIAKATITKLKRSRTLFCGCEVDKVSDLVGCLPETICFLSPGA